MATIEMTKNLEGVAAQAAVLTKAGVPTNGTSGTYAGQAPKGQLLVNTTAGDLYVNTGTQASPTWSAISDVALTVPQDAEASLGATTNLTAYVAGSDLTAVPGSFADLAAVKTYLTTLVADAETRLDGLDTGVGTLITDAEARLDAIEAKVDALLVKLRTAGIISA